MIIGCIFFLLFLVLIFTPPFLVESSQYLSMYFGITYVLFSISDTVVSVPYLALGPELSKLPEERQKMFSIFYIIQYFGVLIAAGFPIILAKLLQPNCNCIHCYITLDVLSIQLCIDKCNLFCSLKANLSSLKIISCFIGSEFLISIIILCLFVKERKFKDINKEKIHSNNIENIKYQSNILEEQNLLNKKKNKHFKLKKIKLF